MIRLYLRIPDKFVRLILQDRFLVVPIPFVRRVKLQFLAQFPVDPLTHLVVSSHILLLFKFAAFALYVIDRFVSISTHNLHQLFCCVLSILALIWFVLMALFWAAIRRGSVSFLRFPFLSHAHVFSCEMSLVSRLKRP